MSKIVTKRSSASNQGEPLRSSPMVLAGRVCVAPRRRVLIARRDAFIDMRLRRGPCDQYPAGEQFTLEGDEEVSIYDPATNPDGVFDLLSDTPAVWATLAGPGGGAA